MAAIDGGTRTCDRSIEKLRTPNRLACTSAIALAGAVVSKPIPRNTTRLSGLARASVTASSGE
jgi:hypothetical protein